MFSFSLHTPFLTIQFLNNIFEIGGTLFLRFSSIRTNRGGAIIFTKSVCSTVDILDIDMIYKYVIFYQIR